MSQENGQQEISNGLYKIRSNVEKKRRVGIDAPLDDTEKTALHLAVQNGNSSEVEDLLRRGAHVDVKDCEDATPLHLAVQFRQHHLFETLVKHGANIEAKKCNSYRPIHLVNYSNQHRKECLEELVKYKPDINARDSEGNSLLLLVAKQWPSPDLILKLLDCGSDVNQGDRDDNNCLHALATKKDLDPKDVEEIIYHLVDRGIDLDVQNFMEETPLHKTVTAGNRTLAAWLLRHGAKLDLVNYRDFTPFEKAVYVENEELTELFTKYLIIRKIKGFPISEWDSHLIESNIKLQSLYQNLEKELFSIRNERFFYCTVYQILSGEIYLRKNQGLVRSYKVDSLAERIKASSFFEEINKTWELAARKIGDEEKLELTLTTIDLPVFYPYSISRSL